MWTIKTEGSVFGHPQNEVRSLPLPRFLLCYHDLWYNSFFFRNLSTFSVNGQIAEPVRDCDIFCPAGVETPDLDKCCKESTGYPQLPYGHCVGYYQAHCRSEPIWDKKSAIFH